MIKEIVCSVPFYIMLIFIFYNNMKGIKSLEKESKELEKCIKTKIKDSQFTIANDKKINDEINSIEKRLTELNERLEEKYDR